MKINTKTEISIKEKFLRPNKVVRVEMDGRDEYVIVDGTEGFISCIHRPSCSIRSRVPMQGAEHIKETIKKMLRISDYEVIERENTIWKIKEV